MPEKKAERIREIIMIITDMLIYFELSLFSNFLLNLCLKKNMKMAKAANSMEGYAMIWF